MIATVGKSFGREAVKRISHKQEEGRTVCHYRSSDTLFAVGEEMTGRDGQYVRIICNPDGSPAERMLTTQGGYSTCIRFSFEAEKAFVAIELYLGRITVSEIVLQQHSDNYELVVQRGKPFQVGQTELYGQFAGAIAAAIERVNCPNCQHAHYSANSALSTDKTPVPLRVLCVPSDATKKVRPLRLQSVMRSSGRYSLVYPDHGDNGRIQLEELGSVDLQVAQTVCRRSGKPAIYKPNTEASPVTRFLFKPEQCIAIVQLDARRRICSIHEIVLTERTVVRIETIVDQMSFVALNKTGLPDKAMHYGEALQAAVERLACHECTHCHYGIPL